LNDRNNRRISKILKSSTLTKLINDVDVILHLEPGNVCYHMLVKYLYFLRVNLLNLNLQYLSYTYCTLSCAKTIKSSDPKQFYKHIHEFIEQPLYNYKLNAIPMTFFSSDYNHIFFYCTRHVA